MNAELVKKKYEKILPRINRGTIHEIKMREGYQKVEIMGDKTDVSPLPTLSGVLHGIGFTMDFQPYPEGGFLLEIESNIECPFKLVLTLENHKVKSMKFSGTSAIPIREIEIGVKDFDDNYFIETLEGDPVRKFLADEETRKLIFSLGKIDRLAFQYRYMKLVYYIEDLEKLDMEWVYDMLDKLARIAAKLKIL